ncbi:hypothetical protein Nmel_014656, partial [Mimus melanotis]
RGAANAGPGSLGRSPTRAFVQRRNAPRPRQRSRRGIAVPGAPQACPSARVSSPAASKVLRLALHRTCPPGYTGASGGHDCISRSVAPLGPSRRGTAVPRWHPGPAGLSQGRVLGEGLSSPSNSSLVSVNQLNWFQCPKLVQVD